jgi:hypothetical protein
LFVRDITLLLPISKPDRVIEHALNEASAHARNHFDSCESFAIEAASNDGDAKRVET